MKNQLDLKRENQAILYSKITGTVGLTLLSIRVFFFKDSFVLLLLGGLFAIISVYFRLTSGNQELQGKTKKLLLGVGVFIVISSAMIYFFCFK